MNLKHSSIRFYYKITNPLRKLYWFLFRPERTGAKCVISHKDKILLVRLAYAHKKWTVPGGRVNNGETHEEAARREAKEEVGIELNNIRKIGSYFHDLEYKRDTIHCFHCEVLSDYFNVDELEIAEAAWFYQNNLPSDLGRQARCVVDMYLEYCKAN